MDEDPRTDDGATNPTADALLDALADAGRRAVLDRLVATGGPCTVEDLTEAVVADDGVPWATDPGVAGTALHHVHLPKLADAGLLEYDTRSGDVVGTSALAVAEPYLDLLATQTGPDGRLHARRRTPQ